MIVLTFLYIVFQTADNLYCAILFSAIKIATFSYISKYLRNKMLLFYIFYQLCLLNMHICHKMCNIRTGNQIKPWRLSASNIPADMASLSFLV